MVPHAATTSVNRCENLSPLRPSPRFCASQQHVASQVLLEAVQTNRTLMTVLVDHELAEAPSLLFLAVPAACARRAWVGCPYESSIGIGNNALDVVPSEMYLFPM